MSIRWLARFAFGMLTIRCAQIHCSAFDLQMNITDGLLLYVHEFVVAFAFLIIIWLNNCLSSSESPKIPSFEFEQQTIFRLTNRKIQIIAIDSMPSCSCAFIYFLLLLLLLFCTGYQKHLNFISCTNAKSPGALMGCWIWFYLVVQNLQMSKYRRLR